MCACIKFFSEVFRNDSSAVKFTQVIFLSIFLFDEQKKGKISSFQFEKFVSFLTRLTLKGPFWKLIVVRGHSNNTSPFLCILY